MKMLIFDFRESEKEFFNNNEFKDFEITFINEPLNSLTQLTEEQWNETDIISVFISSSITEDVIHKFKNLRIIATRSTGYDHIDLQCCAGKNIAVILEQELKIYISVIGLGLYNDRHIDLIARDIRGVRVYLQSKVNIRRRQNPCGQKHRQQHEYKRCRNKFYSHFHK